MAERNFAHAVARIRSLENRLLDNAQFERLLNAPSFTEALALLGETDYNAGLTALDNPTQFEEALNEEMAKTIALIVRLSENALEVQPFLYRYDLENLKRAVKEDEISVERFSRLGKLTPEKIAEMTENGKYDELPDELAKGMVDATAAFKETGDVQDVDRILDRAWFAFGYRVLKNGMSQLLLQWWVAMIDLTNFRSFVRLRRIGLSYQDYLKFFIDDGILKAEDFRELWEQPDEKIVAWLYNKPYSHLVANGVELFTSPAVLECQYDDYLTELIAKAKYISLGIEPLIGYLMAKEIEIKTLRVILVGKNNNISNSGIKERLRRAYA